MTQGNCQVELLVFKCSSLLLNYVKSAFICDKKDNFEVQFITMDTPLNKSLRRKFQKNFSYPTISRNGNLPKNIDCYVAKFQSAIEEGPLYICVVCQRLLYRHSVSLLNLEKYQLKKLVTDMPSFDAKKIHLQNMSPEVTEK